jgi:taurine--2-oxoglutarate transaminase
MLKQELSWEQIKEWDLKYCLHPIYSAEELPWISRCVKKVDQNFIYWADGAKSLDLISGAMSCSGGLWHPKVAAAIKEAADSFGFAVELNPSRYKAMASKILMEDILGPDKWAGACRWVNSGSEAVEMALQIARLYTNRPNIITREWAYHGWTLGAGSCTTLRTNADNVASAKDPVWVRDVPGKPGGFHVVPGHNCYRCSLGHRYPDCKTSDSRLPCINIIESMIRSIGAETVAAIITEVTYGTSGIEPAPEYVPQLRQLTKDLGILWIDDEVLVGMGRLGEWFAYRIHGHGATPDIMTVGKGVISSQLPVGAVVVSKEIAEFLAQRRWGLAATYFAHPLVMAAVVANLERIIEEKVWQNGAKVGRHFGDKLRKLQESHKCIGQVSGRGCFWAVELVKNRKTREPFVKEDRNADIGNILSWPTIAVYARMAEKGVMAGGILPNTLMFFPNCTITQELADMACEAIDYGLMAVDEMCD